MTNLLMAIYFLFTLLTNTYASDKDINACLLYTSDAADDTP